MSIPMPPTPAERRAAGRALRKVIPRSALAGFTPPARRFDPLKVLAAQDKVRIAELVPIRYGRMSVSPLTFLRGSAAVMARDIVGQPTTGIRVQCCGDCHLLNFGVYGTPERNLVFDVNDFDETLEAPFEWDTKRLAASIYVAAHDNGFSAKEARVAVRAAMSAYRTRMDALSAMTNLDIWYARVDMAGIEALIGDPRRRTAFSASVSKTEKRGNLQALMKLGTETKGGHVRIKDQPPLVRHVALERPLDETVKIISGRYRDTLSDDRKRLFDRYEFADTARKVVGVGSVGTDARIALLIGRDTGDPLFLQMKEARASVLAPHAGASPYPHQGQRVVEGQRLMQAASDIFLGWYTGINRKQFYVRQLRDMKGSADVAAMSAGILADYAGLCGGTLAQAHARSGDAGVIAGYLGTGTQFDDAMADFAQDYTT
ncbi:MAG: DUF2252 domain-containing protein, partial [Actinobacteria bacterium]|nr:DUF2252 domain-containing protein [Actinomycetota bacterium]